MKWRYILFAIIVLLILCSSLVIAEDKQKWMYNSQDADLDVEIISYFYRTNDVKEITADLTLYPIDTSRQEVGNLTTTPETKGMQFKWTNPTQEKSDYKINAKIKTKFEHSKIPKKISFPLTTEEYEEYTKSSETIDAYDPDIVKLASELASGEDDLYMIVYKLADWVETNIEYSLDTVTAKSAKPASWVLENKRGVCDELTNLFIAMARSLDIPARFVSGAAYTSAEQFEEGWGAHGWAEVYFPNYGWVPVDVTYKQLGWLDLSHVELKKSLDPSETSVKYSWQGTDIDAGPIDIKVSKRKEGKKRKNLLIAEAKALKPQTGFGSHNALQLEIKNLMDYYVATNANIVVSDSLEIVDDSHRILLLKPNEEKTFYWIFKTKQDLDPSFKYTSFLKVVLPEEDIDTQFTSLENDRVYSKQEIEEDVKEKEETDTKKKSEDIEISCGISSSKFYTYERPEIECAIKNKGNKNFFDLNFCFQECEEIDLRAGGSLNKKIILEPAGFGHEDLKFSVYNDEVFKNTIVPVKILRVPKLNFKIDYTKKLKYNEVALIDATISKKTSDVNDLNLKIYLGKRLVKEENLESLVKQKYILKILGSRFRKDINKIRIVATYKDSNNKEYSQTEEIEIKLINLNFWQRIKIFFRSLFG